MRRLRCLSLGALVLACGAMARAAEPAKLAQETVPPASVQDLVGNHPQGSPCHASTPLAPGWWNYVYPFGGHYLYPYYYSFTFPYLYFYEQYVREAHESRRAADEFEAGLAREGKLTGPAKPGAFLSDHLPRPPRDVVTTLDGLGVPPSPGGTPLVIESGEHTLGISGKR